MLLPPINFIFKLLQQHSTVQIWLYEQLGVRIEGKIRGFDEFMNLVIDEAVEVKQATKAVPAPEDEEGGGRRALGEFFNLSLWVEGTLAVQKGGLPVFFLFGRSLAD